MPPLDSSEAVHNHKRRGSEPDSEEETVEDNGSEQPSRKKTKMEHVDSFPSTLKHDVSSDSLFATRDLSEYRPGSIVRVTLKNFVTYDSITFTPGPHLNMIIGPNGTGKSTIVCAIALGLGGSTSLLGRAKDISDFVKTGKEKATIEIEIKSSNANRSPIKIKRQIKRASNASVWKINGENATHKEVLQKVAAFNIQVDNLCQFLPQDKVVEFAQMTPSELLRETQKAAGAPELSVWHDQLIEMKKKEMTSASRLREKKSHLANLEQRNNLLERDVLRFQQRQKILRQIQVLKTRILYVKYGPLKEAYNRTKAEARALKLEYEKLKESVVPEMNRLEELQALPQTLQAEKDKVSKEIRQKYAIMKQASKELEELEETADSYRNRMKARKKRAIQQRANIEDLKKEIALLEERVNQSAPPEVDLSGFTSQLQEINREIRKLSLDRTELQSQVSDIEREGRQLNEGINKARKGLANLDNVRTQRLERLRQQDPQTAKAYEWLEANRDRFEAAVYGPPLLELNVKNLRYADAIETLLGGSRGSDLKLFIFESKRDYEKFRDTVVSPQNLRISYVWLPELRLSTYQPPCSREQLREFGMDCFALDVLEGPEPILSALCERQNLHTIPLASRSDKTDPERIVASKLFKSWVIGDETYRYRSAAQYSSTAFAVTTRRMRRAEVLAGTVNLDEKQRLQKELDDKLKQLKENEMKIQGFADEINALRDKDEKLRAKKAKLNEKRKALSAERESFERSKVVLENKKQSLQRLESQPEEAQEELRTLQAQLARTLSKRCFLSEQYVEHSQRSFMLVGRRTELHLEQIQAMAELTAFEASCQARESEVVRMKQRLNDKTAENQQIKADATTLRDQINAAREELEEDELLQLEKELSEEMVPVEELERLQAQEEAKADSMYKTNPQVLREYERRKVEIENMCAEVEKDEEELTQAQTDMTKIKDKWAPALEELVKRISTEFDSAFRKIGCVGEVKIDKQEDFEAWGIDILVKFRDAEKLQKLTGQRQSGGERSVSTISYLMALQASARSPFRVVDEINQGMDPRNERLIHRQLVDVACQLNTPQYFLITPKLLPDLYYHERMKVLCINNGEWLPSKMSWQRYFANRK
ncbi:hypothetical protein BZG36_00537 [Bifiguratus adelaidae]|uniref:Structural maintenance of chromosomes protein 5 n=1 Tax=Bifiguratus adelaidae TaxID=1938954 RepID=A0A261Y7B2_9FUNG|nr:hypothetical protein BZG36_00537 [Bifiguratus adelaidae]